MMPAGHDEDDPHGKNMTRILVALVAVVALVAIWVTAEDTQNALIMSGALAVTGLSLLMLLGRMKAKPSSDHENAEADAVPPAMILVYIAVAAGVLGGIWYFYRWFDTFLEP